MNNKNLLYLNLAVDDEDVSLGFANTRGLNNFLTNLKMLT